MKYNVFYGKPPFNHVLGTVEAPDDRPSDALALAIAQFKGAVPVGEEVERGQFYHHHPVVSPVY